jgi:hypothetical protein
VIGVSRKRIKLMLAKINCCHIALCLAFTNLLSLAIFAGYTLKVSQRTLKLEKKNGHEQEQIDELKQAVERLKQSSQRLKKQSRGVKN